MRIFGFTGMNIYLGATLCDNQALRRWAFLLSYLC
jgi:hypothetical protein